MRVPAFALLLSLLIVASQEANAQPDPTLAARLDRIIEAAHARDAFDGVVLVGRGDSVVYARAIGTADRAWGVPMGLDARFPWASVTKEATAALVLGLVGEGRLQLDAPLSRYLPTLPSGGAGRVTLRQLLMNASGLVDPTDVAPDYYTRTDSAAAAAVDAGLAADLAFEPGSRFRYNNLDFLALGRVIEAVTGQSYPDVLQKRVLASAGMATTTLLRDDRIEARVPTGYVSRDSADIVSGGGPFRPMSAERIGTYGAAGALVGTAADLFRFDRALLDGRLFPSSLRDTMFAANPSLGFVALSVWRYRLDVGGRAVTAVERQGGIGGHFNLNLLFPDEDVVLIVMSNVDTADLFRTYTRAGFSYELSQAVLNRRRNPAEMPKR